MNPPQAAGSTFRTLWPAGAETDLAELYAPVRNTPDGARRVRVNMIASVDGGTSRDGTSGSLGGAADRVIFALVRSFADVVVVGAGTMRAERYGPAQLDEEHRRARVARGQTPVPPIAVVTGSADLDWGSGFFTDAEVRPIVLTAEASRGRHRQAAAVADVVIAGGQAVDLSAGLDELLRLGYRDVLVEGGPSINGELAELDAIDEFCLTTAPLLLGGPSSRVLRGETALSGLALELASIVTADGFVFLRYLRGARER